MRTSAGDAVTPPRPRRPGDPSPASTPATTPRPERNNSAWRYPSRRRPSTPPATEPVAPVAQVVAGAPAACRSGPAAVRQVSTANSSTIGRPCAGASSAGTSVSLCAPQPWSRLTTWPSEGDQPFAHTPNTARSAPAIGMKYPHVEHGRGPGRRRRPWGRASRRTTAARRPHGPPRTAPAAGRDRARRTPSGRRLPRRSPRTPAPAAGRRRGTAGCRRRSGPRARSAPRTGATAARAPTPRPERGWSRRPWPPSASRPRATLTAQRQPR